VAQYGTLDEQRRRIPPYTTIGSRRRSRGSRVEKQPDPSTSEAAGFRDDSKRASAAQQLHRIPALELVRPRAANRDQGPQQAAPPQPKEEADRVHGVARNRRTENANRSRGA